MNSILKDNLFITFVVLLALSLLSWLSLAYAPVNKELVGAFIILLAFLKLRIVMIHFMELKESSRAIHLVFEGWIIVVAGITLSIYLM